MKAAPSHLNYGNAVLYPWSNVLSGVDRIVPKMPPMECLYRLGYASIRSSLIAAFQALIVLLRSKAEYAELVGSCSLLYCDSWFLPIKYFIPLYCLVYVLRQVYNISFWNHITACCSMSLRLDLAS